MLDTVGVAEYADAVLDGIKRWQPTSVVLTAQWVQGHAVPLDYVPTLVETVRALRSAGVSRVYVLVGIPHPGFEVPRHAAMLVNDPAASTRLAIPRDRQALQASRVQPLVEAAQAAGATILDASSLFINKEGNYDVQRGDELLFSDTVHVSPEGAKLLEPLLDQVMLPH